jgi:ABC-type dipeptide/oligopeptide/nickel transport system permease component
MRWLSSTVGSAWWFQSTAAASSHLKVDAIAKRDYPIIQGVILLFSGVYVIVNLLVDLSYTVLDPRIRY